MSTAQNSKLRLTPGLFPWKIKFYLFPSFATERDRQNLGILLQLGAGFQRGRGL